MAGEEEEGGGAVRLSLCDLMRDWGSVLLEAEGGRLLGGRESEGFLEAAAERLAGSDEPAE